MLLWMMFSTLARAAECESATTAAQVGATLDQALMTAPFAGTVISVTSQAGDLVSHDSYGMGRVVSTEPAAVTVDFGSQTVRITSPFRKMTVL